MKIRETNFSSGPDLRPIFNAKHYYETMFELDVARYRDYKDFRKSFRDNLQVLTKSFYVTINLGKYGVIKMHFLPGFCFDGASIPQIFRSVFKANGRKMTPCALVHDGFCSNPDRPLSFETVNFFFEQMLDNRDVWGIWFIKKGVDSSIARSRWEETDANYGTIPSYCNITWDDK